MRSVGLLLFFFNGDTVNVRKVFERNAHLPTAWKDILTFVRFYVVRHWFIAHVWVNKPAND